jgi:hypothetical protein
MTPHHSNDAATEMEFSLFFQPGLAYIFENEAMFIYFFVLVPNIEGKAASFRCPWLQNFRKYQLRLRFAYADRIIFPDPSSSVMLVKSLMAKEVRLESEDEEGDDSEAEAPKAGTSEDRLMRLATVLAEEVS